MQNNNFDTIKQIQEAADIVQIVSKYIKLVPRGSNYFGLCPFHSDNNPSLVVSKKKKIFKCFVCGTKGNVFTFVQKKEKISFQEAVLRVAKMINFDTNKINFGKKSSFDPKFLKLISANKQACEWYAGLLKNPENAEARKYLHKRGVTNELIDHFKIGYAGSNRRLMTNMLSNHDEMFGERESDQIWNEQELLDAGLSVINKNNEITDFFIERIIFPIYDANSMLVGFSGRTIKNNDVKYLNSASTKTFNKGSVLYNLNNVKDLNFNKLIIVEGFFDVMAFHAAGMKNVIATMGVSLTNIHINLLQGLKELKTVILSFDNDEAGKIATFENGKKLLENGFDVYVLNRDEKCKDIDEILQTNGEEGVKNAFENRDDFFSYVIKNTFNKKIPQDEINSKVNLLIKNMIDFGDLLNKTKNLKLLAELAGIDFDDLNEKYKLSSKKESGSFEKTKNKVFVEKKTVIVEKNEQSRLHEKIDEVSYNLMKSLDILILMMIKYPNKIDKIFDRFTQTRSYGNKTQLLLVKIINLLHSKENFSKESLLNALENNESKIYVDAKEYLERLFEDPTSFVLNDSLSEDVINDRINSLLKKISDYKYTIVLLEYQIERANLISDDREKNKLRIDELSKRIIELNDLRRKKVGKR